MTDQLETSVENSFNRHKHLWIFAMILALLGTMTSLYSINHHMELRLKGHTEATCNINSAINCDVVAASKYSEIFGIPMGVWGLGYFLGMLFLAATVTLNHRSSKEHEPTWYLLSVVGAGSSIVLGTISLGFLKTVCLVCVTIYILCFLQLGLAWMLYSKRKNEITTSASSTMNGSMSVIIVVALTIVGFNFLKGNSPFSSEVDNNPGRQPGAKPLTFAPNAVEIPINRTAYSGLGEDYRKGPNDAKIVIVEFADYQCPGCGQTAPILEEVSRQLGDRAQLVFKNYPLSNRCNQTAQNDMHPHACDIAKIARCAGSVGKFWEYHTKAFEQQSQASEAKIREWGKGVGLTDAQIDQCLNSPDILAKIRDDVAVGQRIGVNATPTIYINGMKYLGERSVESIRAAVENIK